MSDQFGALFKRAQGGDQRALAELLTLVERLGYRALAHRELVATERVALRVGITGPPGAGKSTLVGQLLGALRKLGLRVGVVAVDPSSPFSRGAILGDRIRYSEHALDPGVFIRSLGTRGSLGGLSAAAYLVLRVFDAVGFDILLIETVGVGQTELEVMHVADRVVVVLVPEAGDSIQAMKAGLLEIADVFVVNKADRPGAESMMRELEFVAETTPAGRAPPRVLKTIATQGQGVDELVKLCAALLTEAAQRQIRHDAGKLRHEARALLRAELESRLEQDLSQIAGATDLLPAIESVVESLGASRGRQR